MGFILFSYSALMDISNYPQRSDFCNILPNMGEITELCNIFFFLSIEVLNYTRMKLHTLGNGQILLDLCIFFLPQVISQSLNSNNLLNSDKFQNFSFYFSWAPKSLSQITRARVGKGKGKKYKQGLLHILRHQR